MARRSKHGRFEVWNRGSDAFKHTDLAYNWDQLDQAIGSPAQTAAYGVGDDFNTPTTTGPTGTSQWLYPADGTQIVNLGNRTLYNIVRALDYNSVPLGGIILWWRPSTAVPLPSGFVPMDGSSYTGTDKHSYQTYGITTLTVPDVRNKMVLGAYETATGSPATALNRDGTAAASPSTNTATDGPGIGAIGGTNVPRNLSHTHGVGTYIGSDHVHSVTDHQHYYTITDHQHVFSTNTGAVIPGHSSSVGGGVISMPNPNHNHQLSGVTAGILGGPPLQVTTGMTAAANTGTASAIAIGGNSEIALTSAIEIQPRYIGLLYIIKIKKPGPLHNTSFPVGP